MFGVLATEALRPEHNVARYCRPRSLADGRPTADAFLLRDRESFLSTNWLEFFNQSDRKLQISGVRNALYRKNFRVNPNGTFAVLNVGLTVRQISGPDLYFMPLGDTNDPSHTGVFGYEAGDTDAAAAIAKLVTELHPAGP